WVSGSFSFSETDLKDVSETLNPHSPDDSIEKLLRDGMSYLEQKKYLDELGITGLTILSPTQPADKIAETLKHTVRSCGQRGVPADQLEQIKKVLSRLDGHAPLAEAVAGANITRRAYIQAVSTLASEGLVKIVEPSESGSGIGIDLPEWVLA